MNPNTKKMRFLAFFLLSLLLPLNMWAQSINESEARQRAQTFLQERNGGKPQVLRTAHRGCRAKGHQTTSACDYYIFNTEGDGGFVIVSGDDRTIPILGYADSGSIQEDMMPEGLKVLLEDYSQQIAGLEDDDAPAQDGRRRAQVRKPVAPLIQTHWDQKAPYNNNCPLIDSKPTYTGCVATALAQVMYYYKFPGGECTTIPGYTTATAQLVLPALEATSFNWNAMTTTYSSTDTGEAADAVAKLMQYCGQAVQMNYKTKASSAFNEAIPDALKTYFSYDGGIRNAYRKCYTYPEWVELIYSELAQARPVVMGGQSSTGGHAFVCDGYESDDYFHINWGWNGGGDGFFRLAVLDPYPQGSNGSSTLDGFSFGEEAVVGIQRQTPGTIPYCLSLEDFYLADYPSSSSHTFTRASDSDKFTVNLNYTLCSYKYGTNNYDIVVMLLDDCGQPESTMSKINNQSMTCNTNLVGPHSVELPSIVNGTYYIKVMSRPHSYDDNGAWMECFDGKQYMMRAVVSGNELTINVPYPKNTKPASAAITVEGNKTVGFEQNVNASITGGEGDYHGRLLLYVNDVAMMGKDVDILAGQTVDVHFSYIPDKAGENTIKIKTDKSDDNSYVIGEGTTVNILAGSSITEELNLETTITNLHEGKLYGNALRATVRVTNPSTTNSFADYVYCSLRRYNNATDAEDNYNNDYMNIKSVFAVVPKSESTENLSYVDINFEFDALDPSKFYRLRLGYDFGGEYANVPIVSDKDGNAIGMGLGYKLYASDGSMGLYPLTESTLDAGSSACADLRGISSFEDITLTPSTNPNCIYLLTPGVETPSALNSCNVVRGTSADNLTAATLALQDGHDFYTPVPFTATNVSYTRTFTLAANGTSGWNTIMLPFSVSSINCEVIGTVDWFHRYSDTGKNFWLHAFTLDAPGYVEFDYADEMAAYTPYIIAVPDNRWGSAWQMTNRAVTFSGSNAHIDPTAVCSFGGNSYKFGGCTSSKSLQDVYLLNNDGSSFVFADTSTDVPAFRAWFSPVDLSSHTSPALMIGSSETTEIGLTPDSSLNKEQRADAWYDLSGRKVANGQKPKANGLYINNGKTIVIQ
jgi:hypothetical protein